MKGVKLPSVDMGYIFDYASKLYARCILGNEMDTNAPSYSELLSFLLE